LKTKPSGKPDAVAEQAELFLVNVYFNFCETFFKSVYLSKLV
jgi:hypothetical protein